MVQGCFNAEGRRATARFTEENWNKSLSYFLPWYLVTSDWKIVYYSLNTVL